MSKKDLLRRVVVNHTFRPIEASDEELARKHQTVRKATQHCAETLIEACPEGRQLSLALTALEEAMMRANAAIAGVE